LITKKNKLKNVLGEQSYINEWTIIIIFNENEN
jgi:hypothetical protein